LVDPVDIALNVAGWVIGALVALAGILYAYRLQAKNERKREDRLTVYEPLYQEMQVILEAKNGIAYGAWLWTPSDAYKQILTRGLLLAERHKAIHKAVAELEARLAIHGASADSFGSDIRKTIQALMEATPVHSTEVSGGTLADLLGHSNVDTRLYNEVASGDEAGATARITELVGEAALRVGGAVSISSSTPGEMAKALVSGVGEDREKYRSDADHFLEQVTRVRDLVASALARTD
jgi:hypothetical protein